VDLDIVRYNAGISGSIKHRVRYEIEGVVSVFLNGRKPNGYLWRLLYQPLWRTGIYALKRMVKKAIRYTPKDHAANVHTKSIIG